MQTIDFLSSYRKKYIAKCNFIFFVLPVLYYAFIIRIFQKNRYRIIVRKGGVFSRFFSFLLQIIAIPFCTLQTGKKFSELFCAISRYFYRYRAKNHYLTMIFQKFDHLFFVNLTHLVPSQQESDNSHLVQDVHPSYFPDLYLFFRKNPNIQHIFYYFIQYTSRHFRKMLKVLLNSPWYTI